MKRLVVAAASLAFALLAAGCDDDGDNKPPTDASTMGDARTDAVVSGMCTGTFAALSRSALTAATRPTGKCAASTDLDSICTANIGDAARGCGNACVSAVGLGADKAEVLVNCVSTCLKGTTTLSAGCSDCYRDLFLCTAQKCLSVCTDANSAACMTCQTTMGCYGAFFACSGLPGGPPQPDAAAPVDAVADTAAPRTDVTPDSPVDTAPRIDAAVDAAVDASPADAGAPDAPADALADATAG